jgi:hypothetical protein
MNSSIHIWQIKNVMNKMDILKREDGAFIQITQYTSSSITLELESAFLAHGQLVEVIGEIQIENEKYPLAAIVKVIASEVINESVVQFEFHLQQIQKNLWKSFLDSKEAAQKHVDNLWDKLKGVS